MTLGYYIELKRGVIGNPLLLVADWAIVLSWDFLSN